MYTLNIYLAHLLRLSYFSKEIQENKPFLNSRKQIRPLLTQMCQFSGTVLQARQKKTLRNKQKSTWAAIFFFHVLNWRELKSVRATWAIYKIQLKRWKASNRRF